MSRSPVFLAFTWLVTCSAILLAGLVIRLAPVELTVAWPTSGVFSQASSITTPAALVLAVLSGLLLFLLAGSAREGNRARPFGELLLFFPLLFAFVWFLLPTGQPNLQAIIAGAGLLVAGWYLFRHSPRAISAKKWKWNKSAVFLDSALILFPVLVGFGLGFSPDLKAGGLSLFLYPVYAFLQLILFLHIPVTRLRAMGVSSENSTLFSALVFALIHWPNPLVMLITLAGMLIWSHQFQNGRRLWQLALVMGLTATTFSQFLPDDLTHHMRVGPGYVRSEATMLLAEDASENTYSGFIEFVYPQTIGRQVSPEELQTWVKLVNRAQASIWTYMFIISTENQNRLARTNQELPPEETLHWANWPENWKSRIAHYASENYWEESGATSEGFLTALYKDILGRKVSTQELDDWVKTPTATQQQRITEVLLDLRLQQGQVIFTGMDVEDFRFPN